jgi:hypothetical protein
MAARAAGRAGQEPLINPNKSSSIRDELASFAAGPDGPRISRVNVAQILRITANKPRGTCTSFDAVAISHDIYCRTSQRQMTAMLQPHFWNFVGNNRILVAAAIVRAIGGAFASDPSKARVEARIAAMRPVCD